MSSKVYRHASLLMIVNYLSWFFIMAKNIGLARLIAPQYFGILAMASVYTSIPYRGFSILGLHYSLLHVNTEQDDDPFHSHFLLALILSLGSFILVSGAAFVIEYPNNAAIFWAMLIIGVFSCFDLCSLTALKRMEKQLHYKQISLLRLYALPLTLFIPLYVAWSGHYLEALVVDRCLSCLFPNIFIWIKGHWWPKWSYNLKTIKWFIHYGRHFWMLELADALRFQGIEFSIGKILGLTPLAYYTKASSFAKLPLISIMQNGIGIVLPLYAKHLSQTDLLTKHISHFTRFSLWGMSFVFGILYVTSPDLIPLVLGQHWQPITPLFSLFCVLYFFKCFMDNLSEFFSVAGHQKIAIQKEVLQTAFVLPLVACFSFFWGIKGAVWGLIGASIPAIIFLYYFLFKLYRLNLTLILLKPTFCFFASIAGFLFLQTLIPFSANKMALSLVFNAGLYCVVFALLTVVFSLKDVSYLIGFIKRTSA